MSLWESKEADTNRYSINENRLFYAWQWFSFHARQRTNVFNFFIVVVGLILAAYARFVEAKPILAGCAAVLGFIVSLIFLGLDVRNRKLTHMGEAVLRRLEAEFLFKEQILPNSYLDKNMRPELDNGAKAGFLSMEGPDEDSCLEVLKNLFRLKLIKFFKLICKHRYLIPLTQIIFAVVFVFLFILLFLV